MFSRVLPCLAFFVVCSAHATQKPEFEWATSAGGTHHDKTRIVNVDSKGNVLLSGEFTGPARFGDAELAGSGSLDFFVAKCNPKGKFLWARSGGGSGTDRGYAVASDAAGNVYAAGHYESKDAEFSGVKLPHIGSYDVFVVKYDPEGKLVWIRTGGGEGYDYAHGIAVDPEGNVVVTGAVAGNAVFGETRLEGDSSSRPFCAKYDGDGKLLWIKTTAGKASGSGHGVAVDAAGNIYVGGMIRGVGSFGTHQINIPAGQDALVAKLNPKGEVVWVSGSHGESSCLFHEITCDAQGRVWASGMLKGRAVFGKDSVETSGEKDSDAFISHYAADGSHKWTVVGKGPATDYGLGVATDGSGQSFLCGTFGDNFTLGGESLESRGSVDVYVAAFGESGSLNWLIQAGGKGGDNAYSMVFERSGSLILGGAFGGTASFGSIELQDTGGNDLYVAKLKLPAASATGRK